MTEMSVKRLEASESVGLAWILEVANLPSAGLAKPGRVFFRFDTDTLVGYKGLEGEGTRSSTPLRRRPVGSPRRRHRPPLVAALDQEARELGVQRLHLLTTNAAPFFGILGYAAANRHAAPPAIAASREFTSLCSASASYLVKVL